MLFINSLVKESIIHAYVVLKRTDLVFCTNEFLQAMMVYLVAVVYHFTHNHWTVRTLTKLQKSNMFSYLLQKEEGGNEKWTCDLTGAAKSSRVREDRTHWIWIAQSSYFWVYNGCVKSAFTSSQTAGKNGEKATFERAPLTWVAWMAWRDRRLGRALMSKWLYTT